MKEWTVAYRTMSGSTETKSVQAATIERAWLIVVQQEYNDKRVAAVLMWMRDESDQSYWQPLQYPPSQTALGEDVISW